MSKAKISEAAKMLSRQKTADPVIRLLTSNQRALVKGLIGGIDTEVETKRLEAQAFLDKRENENFKAVCATFGYSYDPVTHTLKDKTSIATEKKPRKKQKQYPPSETTNKTALVVVEKKTGKFRISSGSGRVANQFKEAGKENNVDPFDSLFSSTGDIYIHQKPFINSKGLIDSDRWSEFFPNIPHPLKKGKQRKKSTRKNN